MRCGGGYRSSPLLSRRSVDQGIRLWEGGSTRFAPILHGST